MNRPLHLVLVIVPATLAALGHFDQLAIGQQVWSGYTKTFSKATGSDPALSQNQDAITSNVKLTRGTSGGLINWFSETSFTQSSSPAGTEWATAINNTGPGLTVDAVHHADLAFTNWFDAYDLAGTHGSSLPNTPAVVHLISSDIYLDLKFTSWTAGNGGAFSYVRAEPAAVPEPTTILLVLFEVGVLAGRRRAKNIGP